MPIDTYLFDAIFMKGVIDRIPKPQTFAETMIFTDKQYPTIDSIMVPVYDGYRDIADMVPFAANGESVDLFTRNIESINNVFLEKPWTYLDPNQLRNKMGSGMSPVLTGTDKPTAAEAYVTKQWQILTDRVRTRHNWLYWQAIAGALAYTGPSGSWAINYHPIATHIVALAGTDLWSNAAADPWVTISLWQDLIARDSGEAPNLMLLGSHAAADLLNNVKFKSNMSAYWKCWNQDAWQMKGPDGSSGARKLAENFLGMDVYEITAGYNVTGTHTAFFETTHCSLIANKNPGLPFTQNWVPIYERGRGTDTWYTAEYNPKYVFDETLHPNKEYIQLLSCMVPTIANMNCLTYCVATA